MLHAPALLHMIAQARHQDVRRAVLSSHEARTRR